MKYFFYVCVFSDKITPEEISRQLRKTLEEENISKTDFTQSIIKKYQPIFRPVLNNPKPWDCLNNRFKNCYKLIFLWLQG